MATHSTAQAVQFRLLGQQLTDIEFNHFMSKLIQSFGKEIIFTSLFNQFINKSSNNSYRNLNQIKRVTQIISDIIISRKIKPKKVQKMKIISQLPKELIGHISSFLSQNNYINFNVANRSIFIACNSPNQLKTLDLFKVKNYSCIHLHNFQSMKHIKLQLNKFNEFPFSLPINNLHELSLNAKKLSTIDIQPFATKNCINLNNLHTLNCSSFGSRGNRFSNPIQLLSQFPMIRCLKTCSFYPNGTGNAISSNKLKILFPHLIGFSFNGGRHTFVKNMIHTFSNNLRALSFGSKSKTLLLASHVNFHNLEELMCSGPTFEVVKTILQSAVNLKKLRLHRAHRHMSQMELKQIICTVLVEKPSLQYLHISSSTEYFETICDAILQGINATKDLERKYIKLFIDLPYNSFTSFIEIVTDKKIYDILNALIESNAKDFMCRIFIKRARADNLSENEIHTAINESKLNELAIQYQINEIDTHTNYMILITNQNCRICGTDESWLAPLYF